MWFIDWGVACGCGSMVPEAISGKLRPMTPGYQILNALVPPGTKYLGVPNHRDCGTGHAPRPLGKDVEGGMFHPCRTCAIYVPLLPVQQSIIGKLGRDCNCLPSSFSTAFLCCIWTGLARELKLEGMSAFFLSFSFSFVAVCGDSNFLEYFETSRFLLENLKVMFPFSTDTVTLCLNVS